MRPFIDLEDAKRGVVATSYDVVQQLEKIMANEATVKTPVPTGARVMLMKDAAPDTTKGGIVLPDKSREQPLTAKVIAVGEKVETLRKGDEVIFASFAGTVFTIDGQEVIVVDEEDILLVLREVNDA